MYTHKTRALALATAAALAAGGGMALAERPSSKGAQPKVESAKTKLVRGPRGKQGKRGKQGPIGPPGPQGAQGVPGPPGTGVKIDFRARSGEATRVVYENDAFDIDAQCKDGAPIVRVRSKQEHSGIALSGTGLDASNNRVPLYAEDSDFNPTANDAFFINQQNPAQEGGTVTHMSPNGRVTTITYLLNWQHANTDCVFVGTVQSS